MKGINMDTLIICNLEEGRHECELTYFEDYGAYYSANLILYENHIDILVGKTEQYNWIALPMYGIASSIARFDEVYTNKDILAPFVGNVTAGVIACSIAYIQVKKETFKDINSEYIKEKEKWFKS